MKELTNPKALERPKPIYREMATMSLYQWVHGVPADLRDDIEIQITELKAIEEAEKNNPEYCCIQEKIELAVGKLESYKQEINSRSFFPEIRYIKRAK